MSNQPLVLVLAAEPEEQLQMLQDLPHVVGNSPSAFIQAAAEASAIFHWSGSRDLLRSVFLACPHVRWVHSRSAGLDNVLFPELVSAPFSSPTAQEFSARPWASSRSPWSFISPRTSRA